MKLPSFDKDGNICMGAVMSAKPKDFEQFGVNVNKQLECLRNKLFNTPIESYSKEKSNLIHSVLDEHSTGNGRMRKPFYQHSAMYCFYYNLFVLLIQHPSYYKKSEAEIKAIDQKMLGELMK
jgi:hypothetical protein